MMLSAMFSRFSMTPILSFTFAPPMIAVNGRSGFSQRLAQHLQLLLHQKTGYCRQMMRDPFCRSMGAVSRAEGVVDV